MATNFDATEFVDSDVQGSRASMAAKVPLRAPTREEVDLKAAEAQQKLAELKRAQEELERQRSELEETRRRQGELLTGREEMRRHLDRGIALLEESEFAARQEAEQTARAIEGLRDALEKVDAIEEQRWSAEEFPRELTRALTVLENARMEWNACRLKFPVLSGKPPEADGTRASTGGTTGNALAELSLGRACKLGLALTWPVALVGALAAGGVIAVMLLR
jgi:hypothetical protein